MSISDLTEFLAASDPSVILAVLVFLALTRPAQRANRRSGTNGGTGRHREADGPERETESRAA